MINRLIFCYLLLTGILQAQFPQTTSYQGFLADDTGAAVADGEYTLSFALYDAETEGNMLWTEIRTMNVRSGVFSVVLGSIEPLNLPFDQTCWLGIAIGSIIQVGNRLFSGSFTKMRTLQCF
jgi:hypothetical protein